jgi:hypothetical protein
MKEMIPSKFNFFRSNNFLYGQVSRSKEINLSLRADSSLKYLKPDHLLEKNLISSKKEVAKLLTFYDQKKISFLSYHKILKKLDQNLFRKNEDLFKVLIELSLESGFISFDQKKVNFLKDSKITN